MGKKSFAAAVAALLLWSYFARPIYDTAWIAAGRSRDAVATKVKPALLRRDHAGAVASATAQGDEIERYLRGLRRDPGTAAAGCGGGRVRRPAGRFGIHG